MRQKVTNGDIKKRFILYKGHTGWKIKTRIFGSLLISFSAFAIAESTGIVDVHAATTSTQTVMSNSASESPKPVNSNNTSENMNQTTQANQLQQNTTDNSSTTTTKYPVLSQNQDVSVGADTSTVNLTADQIGGHFTATVENRDGDDSDNDVADNTHTQTINADGSVSLTTLDSHEVYSSPNSHTDVIGHQAAHVSFEHEIDFSHNFSMSGALGIGSKSSGGADSVGFIFAPGDPSEATKGGSGGQLGLGGLSNAFGFIFDEFYNDNYNDPNQYSITYPYIGWRTTDSSGNLQKTSSGDVQSANSLGLTRSSEPVNEFTMNYDASTQMLTVILNNIFFNRKIDDIDTGYSLSVSASTGGSCNDYSAKIGSFSYTPKTIPLTVHLVDSADKGALLDSTNVTAVANIGDTISVFSTQEAAARAVAAGEVDASLVSVIPTDSAGNVYLIDGDQVIANNNGTVHVIKGEDGIADSTYYSYTVTDGDNQQMTVPVRLAFTAKVTPVDSVTQQPISGLQPVTVIAVAGKPSLVQIPGYTPTEVTLNAPADGQKIADDILPIDQGTTKTDTSTPTTNTANPIGHYYTGNGKTVDGQSVVDNATVGTGQSISDNLDKQPYQDAKGNTISSGGKDINSDDYYWSDVGNANATDSLDKDKPQTVDSILLPTTATLNYWEQQAADNQSKADDYKKQAQDMYNKFIGLSGLTDDQKASADKLLQSVVDIYEQVSDKNGQAETAFENAKTATVVTDIYNDGQTGYENLEAVQNLLVSFKDDLDSLQTTNTKAQNSLTTFDSWNVTYGYDNGFPKVSFGPNFGTVTDEQIKGLDNPEYYEFYTFDVATGIGDTPVTPKDVGQYIFKLTDAGRTYLKSLSESPDAGLYVSGTLTINKKYVQAGIKDSTVTYGDTPKISGELDGTDVNDPADFEIIDKVTNKVVAANQLQAGGVYSIRYTDQAQADLNKGNYNITKFNTGKLAVNKRSLTVTAPQSVGKTYGDKSEPELSGKAVGLVNGDTLDSIGFNLVRVSGEDAGKYEIHEATSDDIKNYVVTVNTGTFIIAKKPVTVTAANISKTYGQPDPGLTFKLDPDSSLVDGDDNSSLDITLNREQGEDFGDYQINGSSNSKNYQVKINSGTFTITQAPATLTIDPVSVVYGYTPTFIDTIKVTGVTDNLEQSDFEVFDSTGKVIDSNFQVGEDYSIRLKDGVLDKLQKANPNYKFSTPTEGALTVNPRDITVTADDSSKTYGDDDPTDYVLNDDSAKGLVTGDILSDLGVKLSREEGENVGEYKIGLDNSSELNKNYKIKVIDGTFTINKRQITVKAADNQKAYGKSDPTFALDNNAASQLVNNDKITDLTVKLTRTSGENAGKYTISGTAENSNYDITVTPGTFTIKPASSDITIEPTKVVYGNVPEINSFGISGITDNLEQSDYEIVDSKGNVVTAGLQVGGDYRVRLKDGALDKLHEANPNYVFNNPDSAELVVTPRDITIAADDSQKVYGQPDPVFNLTKDSSKDLATGDNLSDLGVKLVRTGDENVGNYEINLANPSELNKNYNVSFTAGNFIITKKPVTVVAANNEKTFGDSDPELKLTDDSAKVLVTGDSLSDLGVSLSRAKGEDFGDYQINGSSNSKNYQVKINSGTFTITQAPATLTIDPVSVVYGDTLNFSAKASVGQTTFDQSDFEITDSDSHIVQTSDLQAGGNYSIKLTDKALNRLKSENPNYKFDSITPAKLNVAKRPIVITIDDQPVYVGENDPQNNAVLVKPRIGDDNLLPSLNLVYNEPDSTTVGTYDITASSDNPNFDITFIPGKLIVLGKDIDKDGNVTITEKDKNGNVTKVTKQWNDDGNKETVYNYDPETGTKTVTETNDGTTVDQQTIDPTKGKAILPDNDGVATVVTTDDSGEPQIIHYQSDPDKDGLTSADELIKYGTDPVDPDSDKDGISDGDEVKNGTNPLVANVPNQDAKVVMKNQTVGTTTKMVSLYNKDGKLITDRMLGINTDCQSDEEYTLDGILYYRVSTNEFVKASDVYIYLYQGKTFVRVYNDEKGNLVDYTGSPVSRSLAPSSEWRTDRIAIINGKDYYRVSTNEFVPIEKVYEYVDAKTVVTTNSQTTVYNERGKKTGVVLPANTAYKVDKTVAIDNVVNYRVSTNEFIKDDDDIK